MYIIFTNKQLVVDKSITRVTDDDGFSIIAKFFKNVESRVT